MVDEDYLIVAAHIDETLARKIRQGEFVDFSRLLPRDRVQQEQQNKMQIVAMSDGHLGCAPTIEQGVIASFPKWEQAFRVFSDIFTKEHPRRASELIQYNHVIYTAALSYSWNNVYAYDIDFRLHMARHPLRSWAVILQQAWNLRLRDRHRDDQNRSGSEHRKNKRRDICFRFNQGRCTYGDRCKFEHK